MSLASFFSKETHDAVVRAVQEVESVTSAELVVVVRVRSGRYPEGAARAGGLFALAMLLLLLFLPQEFALLAIPVNVVVGYGIGWAIARFVPPVERLFTSRAALVERTRLAARAELVDGGVTATTGRTGILVYVSVLEREAHVVCDVAVERIRTDPAFCAAERRIVEAGSRHDGPPFIAALRELGPALAALLPRGADDVNELADGVRA